MIDINLLRKESDKIKALILKKEPSFEIDKLLSLDKTVRNLIFEIENLRKEKNALVLKGSKGITQQIREKSLKISKQIKDKEIALEGIDKDFKKLWLSCPNIVQDDVPEGNKESNIVVSSYLKKKVFNFKPKNHLELNDNLDWFDFKAAANITGSHFVLYKNDAVKLIYALTKLMLKNNISYGFNPILPPYLVKEQSMINSGNLPKFSGDFYETQDNLCLIPTAEVSLTSIHANQILDLDKLPIRYTSWTSCFRREAGGYGLTNRGLIRIHQFEKVENFSICEPSNSNDELVRMMKCSEALLQKLGLHYRVSLLAAQDCSFASSKTYDIEIWLPGQQEYYEVSSCSNCTDFQARRAKIRYRKNSESKSELVNTLNASSLALPRLMVALIETYQQEDGTIKFPKILDEEMKSIW